MRKRLLAFGVMLTLVLAAGLFLYCAKRAGAADTVLTGQLAMGDFTKDAPGTWRLIKAGDMPPPYAVPSTRNASTIVPRPESAMPKTLPGFSATVFATGIKGASNMRQAPNGDLFVADRREGKIVVIKAADVAAGKATSVSTFVDGLDRPFGIAFYPPGPNPQFVYIGLTKRIIRYPYHNGETAASGPAEAIVPQINEGGHYTRDVLFSPDGKKMYVAIGSSSNIQNNGPEAEIHRANVLEFNPDGSGLRVYVSGTRNPVSIAWDPRSHAMWACVNERDLLGDDLPPDYVTHLQEGKNYGWPYFYIGNHPDDRAKGTPPVPGDQVVVPDVLLQPHSAPLGIAFYTGKQFPAEYQGDVFVALHGSWNRAMRTGYKIVRVKVRNGKTDGAYEDFVTGLVTPDGKVWARPVGVTVTNDGALLFSDDGNGTIWRVAYTGQRAAQR